MSAPGAVRLFAKKEPAVTGTSRYGAALAAALRELGWRVATTRSEAPWPHAVGRLARRLPIDPAAFWASYPLLPPRPRRGEVLHLTIQTLATSIVLARPRGPVVVTVHDILPYTLRDDPELGTLRHPVDLAFYRLALRGLGRADRLLADSRHTADELVRLGLVREEAVEVVPLGVDHGRFAPTRPSPELRERYGLRDDERYVVYVGSEDPRKNLPALFEAFARAAARRGDLRLLKVGHAHHLDQRARLVALAERLGVADRVRFLEAVPDADLPGLYASATVCAVPALYEGFGLPVLEAMACGAPVVCANRTSLPEVAGDAALVVEPTVGALAAGLERVVTDAALARELRERGLRRAATYTWRRTAELTGAGYERALGSKVLLE